MIYEFVTLKVVLTLANSADPNEMQHYNAALHLGIHCLPKFPFKGYAAFHLGLHCLLKYPFRGF